MQDARDRRRKFCSEFSVDAGNRENGAIQEPSSTMLTSFDNLVENCIDAKSAVDAIIPVIAWKQTFLDIVKRSLRVRSKKLWHSFD